MHEVVIKYKNRKTLKALTALGEYLGFTIADPEKKEKKEREVYHINGIPVESGAVEIIDQTVADFPVVICGSSSIFFS